jgi:radical SAM protein with 4Fe4S-binding SPASM domain
MPHSNKQMISFFLTTKCNLRCVYCYNSKERAALQEKSLPLEIAKAGIDEFFANNRSRHIRFYGPGEPTMEFALMCQIVDYAKEKDENVTVEIQTNGTFSPKVCEWVLDNINIVWVSFDGTPDIQDKQRPLGDKLAKSSIIIEENVKMLVSNRKGQDLMVGARVTMTNLNVNRQVEMVDYFNSLGIKYVWTDPIFPEVKGKPVCVDKNREEMYYIDLMVYVKNFIEAHRYAKKKGLFYGSFLMCNFDGETKIHCRTCTPVPHLTTDGYVSACDMVVYGENAYHMECFIYGKWDEQNKRIIYFDDKIKALRNRNIDNMYHCKKCIAKLHCGGYCPGEVQNETGRLDGQKPDTCKAVRALYKELGACKTFDYMHP